MTLFYSNIWIYLVILMNKLISNIKYIEESSYLRYVEQFLQFKLGPDEQVNFCRIMLDQFIHHNSSYFSLLLLLGENDYYNPAYLFNLLIQQRYILFLLCNIDSLLLLINHKAILKKLVDESQFQIYTLFIYEISKINHKNNFTLSFHIELFIKNLFDNSNYDILILFSYYDLTLLGKTLKNFYYALRSGYSELINDFFNFLYILGSANKLNNCNLFNEETISYLRFDHEQNINDKPYYDDTKNISLDFLNYLIINNAYNSIQLKKLHSDIYHGILNVEINKFTKSKKINFFQFFLQHDFNLSNIFENHNSNSFQNKFSRKKFNIKFKNKVFDDFSPCYFDFQEYFNNQFLLNRFFLNNFDIKNIINRFSDFNYYIKPNFYYKSTLSNFIDFLDFFLSYIFQLTLNSENIILDLIENLLKCSDDHDLNLLLSHLYYQFSDGNLSNSLHQYTFPFFKYPVSNNNQSETFISILDTQNNNIDPKDYINFIKFDMFGISDDLEELFNQNSDLINYHNDFGFDFGNNFMDLDQMDNSNYKQLLNSHSVLNVNTLPSYLTDLSIYTNYNDIIPNISSLFYDIFDSFTKDSDPSNHLASKSPDYSTQFSFSISRERHNPITSYLIKSLFSNDRKSIYNFPKLKKNDRNLNIINQFNTIEDFAQHEAYINQNQTNSLNSKKIHSSYVENFYELKSNLISSSQSNNYNFSFNFFS